MVLGLEIIGNCFIHKADPQTDYLHHCPKLLYISYQVFVFSNSRGELLMRTFQFRYRRTFWAIPHSNKTTTCMIEEFPSDNMATNNSSQVTTIVVMIMWGQNQNQVENKFDWRTTIICKSKSKTSYDLLVYPLTRDITNSLDMPASYSVNVMIDSQ